MAPNPNPPSLSLNHEEVMELMELERTLIPALNRVRQKLDKPKIILPRKGEQWRLVKRID